MFIFGRGKVLSGDSYMGTHMCPKFEQTFSSQDISSNLTQKWNYFDLM